MLLLSAFVFVTIQRLVIFGLCGSSSHDFCSSLSGCVMQECGRSVVNLLSHRKYEKEDRERQ